MTWGSFMTIAVNNLTILTHTHSDCADIWPMYFRCMKNYLGSDIPHHVVTDEFIRQDYSITQTIYQKDSYFSDRLSESLDHIDTEFVLFMLEDYVLYAPTDNVLLNTLIETMKNDSRIGFIRLLQSGATPIADYDDNIYVIHPDERYFFSTQATIWRKDLLKQLVSSCDIPSVRSEPETSPHLSAITTIGACVKGRGKLVGGHFDSLCLPYVATACVGGKWNVSEYPDLITMLSDYGIDITHRGCR